MKLDDLTDGRVITHRQRETVLALARAARDRFRIISPWVTGEQQLTNILDAASHARVEVTIRWPVDHSDVRFMTEGVLDLLDKPSELGLHLAHPDKRLHGKVYICDDRAALVTSANLTGMGLPDGGQGNHEVGVVVRGRQAILELVQWAEDDLEPFAVADMRPKAWKKLKASWLQVARNWPKNEPFPRPDLPTIVSEVARTRRLIAKRLDHAKAAPEALIEDWEAMNSNERAGKRIDYLYKLYLKGRKTPFPVRVLTRQPEKDDSLHWKFGVTRHDLNLWERSVGKLAGADLLGLLVVPREAPVGDDHVNLLLVEGKRLFDKRRLPKSHMEVRHPREPKKDIRDVHLTRLGEKSWEIRIARQKKTIRLTKYPGGVWRLPPVS